MRRFSTPPQLTLTATLLLGTLITSAGPAQSLVTGLAGLSGQVVTAAQSRGSLRLLDLETGAVTTVSVPASAHIVDASPDDRWLFAGGELTRDGDGHSHGDKEGQGLLVVLDATRRAAAPVAEIPVGSHPAHGVTYAKSRRAFGPNASDDTASVVALRAQEVVSTPATGDYPHGPRIRPQADELYVADFEDGTTSVIDIAQQAEGARIPVGASPAQVGFLPDRSWAYISLREEDAVSIIDNATREVVARTPVGNGPIQLIAKPDGRSVYVANEGSEEEPSDLVSVMGAATDSVLATIIFRDRPYGISVSDEAAFVASIRDDSLSVIDLTSDDVLAIVPVGDGPKGSSISRKPSSEGAEIVATLAQLLSAPGRAKCGCRRPSPCFHPGRRDGLISANQGETK